MPLSGQTWDQQRFAPNPALEPFRELLAELAALAEFPDAAELGAWVDATRGQAAPEVAPLRFVLSRPKSRRIKRGSVVLEALYDARITCDSEVPCLTRSYHDLFNALMFKAFPRAKRALHARQYAALGSWAKVGAERLPGRRTREQDALALFDEGGSVVLCPTHLQADFSSGARLPLARPGADSRLVVFGHALFEHLTEGQANLRSSARVLFVPELLSGPPLLPVVDDFVARLLADPQRFVAPDADAVVFFERGEVTFRRFDPVNRISRLGAHSAPRSSEQ